jgi:hypothetical protein
MKKTKREEAELKLLLHEQAMEWRGSTRVSLKMRRRHAILKHELARLTPTEKAEEPIDEFEQSYEPRQHCGNVPRW